ncbi:DUF805 domain-containing protein [Macrococcus hajekii]|uniref:DUF805 domain-containing protein n=1 Tax=Macrococcus hajekii TaxID=198482 RepID=A0A4R6BJ38_9STAP|nr:DUF805 domain-containing protein [Macrococcus hajekii]TDM01618.1 DUF805 domain-containing protein [Macrococcus hajekii]GGB01551.1 DUF805 domain-containing protein [Macrococcus hajekii]
MYDTFLETYRRFWQQGLNFKGRATRQEYWVPQLLHFGILMVLYFIMTILFQMKSINFPYLIPALYIIGLILILVVLIPHLAVMVRRFHDVGHSGWWVILFVLSPVIWRLITHLIIGWFSNELSGTVFIVATLAYFSLQIWGFVQLVRGSMEWRNKWGEQPI